MRSAPLTTVKGGINRLRTRGGARADSLYDLLNGYLTDAGTIRGRQGTKRIAKLDSSTRGLVAFGGLFHTFCHRAVFVPAGFTLHIIAHPDDAADSPIALSKVHFAAPFLGSLYVVAEFEGGDIFHYWLQDANDWQADTVYKHGQLVSPTVPTGLVYRASRLGDPFPSWAPGVPREDGQDYGEVQSVIEPTVYNDFHYTCVATFGTNPKSGTTEPVWPTEEGAQIVEQEGVSVTPPTTTSPPVTPTPGTTYTDRYGIGGGIGGGSPAGVERQEEN